MRLSIDWRQLALDRGAIGPVDKEPQTLQTAKKALSRTIKLSLLVSAAGCASANGADDHARRVLMRIEPDTRLEQVCDLEAMNRIARATPFRPDRAKSNITVAPVHEGDEMTANGGAFRSHGKWYALTFRCVGNSDHTKVLNLTFQVGAEIPKKRWDDLALWP